MKLKPAHEHQPSLHVPTFRAALPKTAIIVVVLAVIISKIDRAYKWHYVQNKTVQHAINCIKVTLSHGMEKKLRVRFL